jgi:hypothetical protein
MRSMIVIDGVPVRYREAEFVRDVGERPGINGSMTFQAKPSGRVILLTTAGVQREWRYVQSAIDYRRSLRKVYYFWTTPLVSTDCNNT